MDPTYRNGARRTLPRAGKEPREAARRARGPRRRAPAEIAALTILAAAFPLLGAAAGHLRAAEEPAGVLAGIPDPAIIAAPDGAKGYYAYATGRGLPFFRSDDLVRWERAGRVFSERVPAWAAEAVPGSSGIWAPDIARFGGLYRLYYSVSTFGKQRSVIGLATNRTIDPESPEYRWEDRGEVISSRPGDSFNAIDPAAFVDHDGRVYLFWGSFWSGIKAIELDPETGKPMEGARRVDIVDRRQPPNAVEAPYVVARDGLYWLFVSFDSCCDGAASTYRMMMGRSESVLGPYIDASGRKLLEGGATMLVAGDERWRGPGHNSVLVEGDRSWLVHHTYDVEHLNRQRIMQVRPLYWPDGGWPVAGEPLVLTHGKPTVPITAAVLEGTWLHSIDYREDGTERIELLPDGKVRDAGEGTAGSTAGTTAGTTAADGSWSLREDRLLLRRNDPAAPGGVWVAEAVVEPTGDSYIGRDQAHSVVRGRRVADDDAPGTASTAGEPPPGEPPPGFTALFNGKDLAGWRGGDTFDHRKLLAMPEDERARTIAKWTESMKAHWSVEGDELVNDGHGAYATTEKDYGDFELLVEYRTVPRADSGIYLRGVPQVQIWDYTEEAKFGIGADKGSGGLWNNSPGAPGKDPLVLADRPFGEWNSLRILMVGSRVSVWLNGKMVVDHAIMENYYDRKVPVPPRGPIQLQTHGGEIRWRNVSIREIGPEEANEILASRGGEGFRPIFNGRDLEGWAGAVGGYEVVDGALRCKRGTGGTIYLEEELSDFAARMEIRIPPGGNNGLAIRYPGSGDTAYVGMCELQVLDNEAPMYRTLDPRQYHGSAYGMVAAHRGYLRVPGEWNFQEVTVRGSTIRVELNGTVILDADLSKVTELMGNTPHPGKDRTSGLFGFAGHGDPVGFRKVAIKRM